MYHYIGTDVDPNLFIALENTKPVDIISELHHINPQQKFLISQYWNTEELSIIPKHIPEGVIILFPCSIHLETVKESLSHLLPLRYVYFDKNLSFEQLLDLVQALPQGVKFLFSTNLSQDKQIALLKQLPPYTIVSCTNPNISRKNLWNIIQNLNPYCILEIHSMWPSIVIEAIFQNLPKHRGVLYQDFLNPDFVELIKHLPPERIMTIPNAIPYSVLSETLRNLQIGTVVYAPDYTCHLLLEHLPQLLEPGNIIYIQHENLLPIIDDLSSFIGVQFSPHLSQEKIIQNVRNFNEGIFYAAHPQEQLSRMTCIMNELPEDSGFLPPSNINEETWLELCKTLKSYHWLIPPLSLSAKNILKGLQFFSKYTQMMFHPYTDESIQLEIIKNIPDGVIYTPHPKTEFIHLMNNLENLKSLAIFMPLIEPSCSNDIYYLSMDMLNPEAIFMPQLNMDAKGILETLKYLQINAIFMPHPEIFENCLLSILKKLPEYVRYMPNCDIDLEINKAALTHLKKDACIIMHPHTSVSYAHHIRAFFKITHELSLYPHTPQELYVVLKDYILKQKRVTFSKHRFNQHTESLTLALSIISNLKAFDIYQPHYSLSLDILLICLKHLPSQVIFRPHHQTPKETLFAALKALPSQVYFSPDIALPATCLLEALDFLPNRSMFYANILTSKHIMKYKSLAKRYVMMTQEIEDFLNTQAPREYRP